MTATLEHQLRCRTQERDAARRECDAAESLHRLWVETTGQVETGLRHQAMRAEDARRAAQTERDAARAEVVRLRTALREMVRCHNVWLDPDCVPYDWAELTAAYTQARAALGESSAEMQT